MWFPVWGVSRYLGMPHLVSSGSGGLWATHSSIIAFVALGIFSGIFLSWMCFYPVLCARPCSRAFVAAFGLRRMPHCCWLPRCLCWLLACIVLRVNLVMLLWAHVTVHWLPRTGGWSSWLFPMLALRPSAGVADHFQLQVTIVTVVGQVVESHDVVLCTFSFMLIRLLNLARSSKILFLQTLKKSLNFFKGPSYIAMSASVTFMEFRTASAFLRGSAEVYWFALYRCLPLESRYVQT